MTLYQITSYLKQIALSSPYIRTAEEGSVYTIMNGNPHSRYGVFVISQTQHRQDDIFDYYGFNMFVIDRLVDDLESNRLQIQSLAKEVLANTILTLITKFYGITHNELQFHPFTEKFVDLTAGQYVQVTFQVPRNLICPDDYNLDFNPEYVLEPLVVEITENGIFEYEPEDIDGYNKVTVTVNVDIPDNYESGFTSGVTYQKSLLVPTAFTENGVYSTENGYSEVTVNVDTNVYYNSGFTSGVTYQKSLLSAITITDNGEYITDENGVSAITVDVSGYTEQDLNDAYESGITSGVSYQKSLLQDISIEHNGEYQVENGFKKVTVNVPQSGESIYNQTKSIEYSGNGEYTLTYDEGYTGLEAVNININVPQSAYTSGYTEQDLIDAYNSGITYQKSLLSAVTLTENGTYIYPNGVSAITVNVSGDTPTPPTPSGDTSAYTDMYLTFEIISGGSFDWIYNEYNSYNSSGGAKTIEYRINKGEWNSITAIYYRNLGQYRITVNTGDIIEWRGNNEQYSNCTTPSNKQEWQNKWHTNYGVQDGIVYNVYGNILSIIYGDDFKKYNTISSTYTFANMFGHHSVISAEHLILPNNTTDYCYEDMFGGCTLVKTPLLPATTLAPYCYGHMFARCPITQTPLLPATNLNSFCYSFMFAGCSSLTEAPVLPATTLAEYCYQSMFEGCTVLTTAPVLLAKNLILGCYNSMFQDCTNLTYVKCLALDGMKGVPNPSNTTWAWLGNVATSGTFVKKAGVTDWTRDSSGIPSGWTVQNV